MCLRWDLIQPGCFVSSEGRAWYRREMWTARLNLNRQLMSFSGRWTWDGVPCPRQHFCSSLTELEVTQLGLGDIRRRAVRSRSASQSRASTPISLNLFASAFLITPHAAESVLNQKWDPHAQANQMRSNEKLMQVCWYYRTVIPRAVSESTASRQEKF